MKKTLATSVSITFAGLIRAHGEEAGASGATTLGTVPENTTFRQTTMPETTLGTTCGTTNETTTPKDYKMHCVFPEEPSYPVIFNSGDSDPTGWVNTGTEEAPLWNRVWVQVTIESSRTKDPDDVWYQDAEVTFICKGRWALSSTVVTQAPTSGWSTWAEIKRIAKITCDSETGKMTRSRTAADRMGQQGDTFNDGSKLETVMNGGEGGEQEISAKFKAPFGDFGDTEVASVIWESEDRWGK